MANTLTFNNTTYTGNELSTGLYATVPLVGTTYTGSAIGATGASYSLSGTVTAVGSTVSLTETLLGQTLPTTTATYEGYFTSGGATYYVFADSGLQGVAGGAFAVSSTGAPVPLSLNAQITPSVPAPTCFLSGTRILTPTGEVAVETVSKGDLVAVLRDGATQFEPVLWVGHGNGTTDTRHPELDNAPVRIRSGAIADNVPARDLLVTPEHCVFLDGVLIPARMLVNGGSITSETQFGAYSFHHIEMERHAILIAEGAHAESYLDTGNRANFHNHDVAALMPAFASPAAQDWSSDAAAPLAVDRATVEPIWNALAERSRAMGLATKAGQADASVGADLALRIVTETGAEILPTLTDGHVYAFVIPSDAGALRLRSRAARPSDVVGPFLDDRRTLGVQVGRIGVGGVDQRGAYDAHLTAEHLPGWHAAEADGSRRWTDGDAVLPIDTARHAGDALFLDIEVVGIGPYRAAA